MDIITHQFSIDLDFIGNKEGLLFCIFGIINRQLKIKRDGAIKVYTSSSLASMNMPYYGGSSSIPPAVEKYNKLLLLVSEIIRGYLFIFKMYDNPRNLIEEKEIDDLLEWSSKGYIELPEKVKVLCNNMPFIIEISLKNGRDEVSEWLSIIPKFENHIKIIIE